jgi:molybdenum cofactor biosynthesis enzyme MoaA
MTNSKTFCMHPFTGLSTREDGAILACCRSHPVGWIQNETLEEVWNNDNMRRIRHQVLNNEWPKECHACQLAESNGVESLRQRHIEPRMPESRVTLYPDAMESLREDYTMPFKIPTMELKLNNLCNLKCRMCHPMDSTSWNDWGEIKEFYKKENNIMYNIVEDHNLERKPFLDKFQNDPNWWGSLEKNLPYFRRVEFAGGEPLMDPQHYRILDMLMPYAGNIELKYATNLTTLGITGGRTVHDYWPNFKSIAVNVSIDGIGNTYEYIRGNGNWNLVVNNIKEIQKFQNIRRIVGAVTVQINNVLSLENIIECFFNELGIIFHTHRVEYPKLLSGQVIPRPLLNVAVERLENSKIKIKEYEFIKQHPELYDYTIRQIQDNINYLKSKDQSNLWKDCVEFNQRLDNTRNQNFLNNTPEFRDYI